MTSSNPQMTESVPLFVQLGGDAFVDYFLERLSFHGELRLPESEKKAFADWMKRFRRRVRQELGAPRSRGKTDVSTELPNDLLAACFTDAMTELGLPAEHHDHFCTTLSRIEPEWLLNPELHPTTEHEETMTTETTPSNDHHGPPAVAHDSRPQEILDALNAAIAGDLLHQIDVTGDDVVGQVGASTGRLLEELRRNMTLMKGSSDTLHDASDRMSVVVDEMGANADRTSEQASLVASGAEQVHHNVQTVAAAAEEMAIGVRDIAKNASEAARVATGAVQMAQSTNDTISKLGESSMEIGKVIKVITSIAQQTNLLALNATIEAARAGEAGKGFAVVANEVKELAKETAKATEDISQKIEAIQNDTKSAVQAIAEISGIIVQINDFQSSIASAVEEQTATTNEISRSVSEAARGSEDIAKNITKVAEAAKGTTQGAETARMSVTDLTKLAKDLRQLVEQYRL
ncbi:MAG TPA: methyl-accepting chemotaxis protein [Myxococcales bacterium LLY-WYZ-16_1]|jgi:methyl-accepting chemotaxis protein|nr:methyl-accepting chemotaxis protein [Myxococcales bacterium LLY-WYZ-16_1]